MKLFYIPFLTVLFTVFLSVQAQPQLTPSCNLMRAGDKIIKQQVEYKDPGRSGENVLWDFSRQESIDDHYELRYYAYEDSLFVGQENRTLYKYLLRTDSLFSSGFENRTTLIENSRPELLLIYPCQYGDRYESYFHGNGDYCDNLSITARGKSLTHADAFGIMILPSGDTLRHVLRLHQTRRIIHRMVPHLLTGPLDSIFNKDSIDFHLLTDSTYLQTDRYLWYADGYRYPVFETVETTTFAYQKAAGSYQTAFFYTPEDQYYDLDSDPENQAKRDEEAQQQIRMAEARAKGNAIFKGGDISKESILNYNLFKNTDGQTLTVEYCTNTEASVSIQLFDMQGRQLSGTQKSKRPRGFYQENLLLDNFPNGEYMLRIVANGKVFGEKVVKH